MKKLLLGVIVGLLMGGVAMWSLLQHRRGEEKPEEEHAHKEGHVQHGTNGETILKFDAEAEAKMGLKLAALEDAALQREIKCFGRVLDPGPLAAAVSDISLARAQLEGSTRELNRLKALFGQNQNVSARAVESAEIVVQRDKLAVEAAHLRLATAWGPAVTGMKDLDAVLRSAIEQNVSIIRVDVGAGDLGTNEVAGLRIVMPGAADKILAGRLLGRAVSADPQVQGLGYLAMIEAPLAANTAVSGWLSLAGEPVKGVTIPRDAIVRHEGEAFIFVQAGKDGFERKEVELEHPVGRGWFNDEMKAGTMVVVSGGQQLLSEEFKGEGEGE